MVSLVSMFTLLVAAAAIGASTSVDGGDVTYDERSLIVNGEHKLLFSGSIHYPRSTPEMWPSLIKKAKQGGLDVIETYAFWNLHEPQQGQYDFSGNKDIVRFFKEVQSQGLYACLRIGPFIESEWNYGGFPFWLHDVPGIVYRSDNEPFKFHMQNFTTYIVNLMKSEKLFASQGGPIILSQIENEYQNVERAFHENGPPYVKWAAEMAVGLDTGVPWAMCKQDDAPDPVINACNGMRCGETFKGPNSPNKPFIWTEDWTSQYQVYGNSPYIRSAEDIAFHVALFLAKKGSFVNYYMYHGGTNFGRTSSAYVVTSYYDQAPLDEYGMIWLPKWGHLRELHAAAKLCEKTLLFGDQNVLQVGPNQQGYVFRGNSGDCAAFLVNNDSRNDATVQFQDASYVLPRKSISILPDCRTVAFNTAKVGCQSSTRARVANSNLARTQTWAKFKENVVNFDDTSFRANSILEHMNTTKDASDYLWYTFKFDSDSDIEATLEVNSLAHVLRGYVNGELIGSSHGGFRLPGPSLNNKISLVKGCNNISLLSVMVGLPDSGAYLERRVAGLRRVRIWIGSVLKDFSNYSWGYQVGLLGEKQQVYSDQGLGSVQWNSLSYTPQPLTWYKTVFDAPRGNDPVALNLGSMGKGEAWVNGQSIGRYWVSYRTTDGSPSQTWYNVPRSSLKPSDNSLVLLEEEGGSPSGISVDTVSISKVCSHVTSTHPPSIFSWGPRKERNEEKTENNRGRTPRVQLHCPSGRNISKILFASFGNPAGDCQSYATGSCHSPRSKKIVEKACLGRKKCAVPIRNQRFGEDPCPGIDKALLVEAQCS